MQGRGIILRNKHYARRELLSAPNQVVGGACPDAAFKNVPGSIYRCTYGMAVNGLEDISSSNPRPFAWGLGRNAPSAQPLRSGNP